MVGGCSIDAAAEAPAASTAAAVVAAGTASTANIMNTANTANTVVEDASATAGLHLRILAAAAFENTAVAPVVLWHRVILLR